MEIVTVIPTRGLIHSQTIEGLKRNGIDGFLTISGLGIPDAQNKAVEEALKEYSSYVLFIEDDVVMPDGALEQMIKLDEAIVAVDYPVDNGWSTICRKDDEILWCGLGCTLIKRGVLATLPQPTFETHYSWKINEPFELERIDNPSKYGGQDINFCIKAREYGFKIAQAHGFEAKHLRVKNLDRNDRSNNGGYEIYELPPVSKRQEY